MQWDDQLGLGLVYMHARHYSPALGRFVQPDPDRSEANLYAYAANSAAVVRSYVVDESGTVVRMTVAPGEPDAGITASSSPACRP